MIIRSCFGNVVYIQCVSWKAKVSRPMPNCVSAGSNPSLISIMLSEQDLADHAWVDEWVLADVASRGDYTPEQWKHHFCAMSRKLSSVLRHGTAGRQLPIACDGIVLIRDILRLRSFNGFSRDDLDICVRMRNGRYRTGPCCCIPICR